MHQLIKHKNLFISGETKNIHAHKYNEQKNHQQNKIYLSYSSIFLSFSP